MVIFVFVLSENDAWASFVRTRARDTREGESNEKAVHKNLFIKIGPMIFMKRLLVAFSRGRGFECFMSHEVMKENTKAVTETAESTLK
jgi:hypothetical protein